MKEELVTLSREKGFMSRDNLTTVNDEYCYLWMCELQKWLREKHNLHICIEPKWSYEDLPDRYSQPKEYYGYVVGDDDFNEDEQVDIPFKSYEDCLEDALIVALNSL